MSDASSDSPRCYRSVLPRSARASIFNVSLLASTFQLSGPPTATTFVSRYCDPGPHCASTMVGPTRENVLTKAKFSSAFSKRKTQAYSDNSRSSQSRNLRTIDWNPLGTLIATGSSDRGLRVWNPEKPQVKNSTELRGHTGPIERVAWNPTREAELASCSADGTVRFWDVRSKNAVGKVEVGGDAFTLAWRPDGSELVVGRKVRIAPTVILRVEAMGR